MVSLCRGARGSDNYGEVNNYPLFLTEQALIKMADILQTTFPSALCVCVSLRILCHFSLPRCLTSHYLNQWWFTRATGIEQRVKCHEICLRLWFVLFCPSCSQNEILLTHHDQHKEDFSVIIICSKSPIVWLRWWCGMVWGAPGGSWGRITLPQPALSVGYGYVIRST